MPKVFLDKDRQGRGEVKGEASFLRKARTLVASILLQVGAFPLPSALEVGLCSLYAARATNLLSPWVEPMQRRTGASGGIIGRELRVEELWVGQGLDVFTVVSCVLVTGAGFIEGVSHRVV